MIPTQFAAHRVPKRPANLVLAASLFVMLDSRVCFGQPADMAAPANTCAGTTPRRAAITSIVCSTDRGTLTLDNPAQDQGIPNISGCSSAANSDATTCERLIEQRYQTLYEGCVGAITALCAASPMQCASGRPQITDVSATCAQAQNPNTTDTCVNKRAVCSTVCPATGDSRSAIVDICALSSQVDQAWNSACMSLQPELSDQCFVATPTPTGFPVPTSTFVYSPTPTPIPSATPFATPPMSAPVVSPAPTAFPIPGPTFVYSPTPTPIPSATPFAAPPMSAPVATPTPSAFPSPAVIPVATLYPTADPTLPSSTPWPTPTPMPTVTPTAYSFPTN